MAQTPPRARWRRNTRHRKVQCVQSGGVEAVFTLCRDFGAYMLSRQPTPQQGQRGSIINIASLVSFSSGLTVPAYASPKGGVAQLTKALSNEWAGRGVNVNAIAPDYVATDMNEALINDETPRPIPIFVRSAGHTWRRLSREEEDESIRPRAEDGRHVHAGFGVRSFDLALMRRRWRRLFQRRLGNGGEERRPRPARVAENIQQFHQLCFSTSDQGLHVRDWERRLRTDHAPDAVDIDVLSGNLEFELCVVYEVSLPSISAGEIAANAESPSSDNPPPPPPPPSPETAKLQRPQESRVLRHSANGNAKQRQGSTRCKDIWRGILAEETWIPQQRDDTLRHSMYCLWIRQEYGWDMLNLCQDTVDGCEECVAGGAEDA
ncbi:hypothetical protein AYL99_11627 [Fonsecaea erecta]|uniref:Uncharacterized protein n=1 Tax=Fonsecaea erecta TaxID=1367422 RepID=A0A178Z2U0_9EURO|nr:hypothetical protein AYL99_11627 [Fonsecaea erecta]OAP54092.1 hypothetical protein AYL99_11627 [Fonsecaea erecta]